MRKDNTHYKPHKAEPVPPFAALFAAGHFAVFPAASCLVYAIDTRMIISSCRLKYGLSPCDRGRSRTCGVPDLLVRRSDRLSYAVMCG